MTKSQKTEIILMALDLLIAHLEIDTRESTYSQITQSRLAHAKSMRNYVASNWPPNGTEED